MNLERSYIKQFINEALNKDSTWEQFQSDRSLSPAEKKVVELLPLLNDKSDILALKTIFPDIVNAFMEYEGINESQEFEGSTKQKFPLGSTVKIIGNGELPKGVNAGDIGYVMNYNPKFDYYTVHCMGGILHWDSLQLTEDELELYPVQSLPGKKEDAIMKSIGFIPDSIPTEYGTYDKEYSFESNPTLKVCLYRDVESKDWIVKFFKRDWEYDTSGSFGLGGSEAPEIKEALKIAVNDPNVLNDARKYHKRKIMAQIAQKINAL